MLQEFLGSLWFFLPAGVSNIAPVLASKFLGEGRPVDFGKKWKGKPILGAHKTWQGFIVGTFAGGLFFLLQIYIASKGVLSVWDVADYSSLPVWLGFSMAFGALAGDSVKSFFKRRSKVKPGESWMPWDQTDYVLGALVFTLPFVQIPSFVWLTFLISYPVLHVLFSLMGYYTGVKKDKF